MKSAQNLIILDVADRVASSTRDPRLHETMKHMKIRRHQSKILAETVNVHLTKLEDLPVPLSKREFQEVCKREGILAPLDKFDGLRPQTSPSAKQLTFEQVEDWRAQDAKKRVDHTVSNLFGAYLAIYESFKTWHTTIIQNRTSKMVPRDYKSAKPSKKDQLHTKSQQQLVTLLIEYGIGSALQNGPLSPGSQKRGATAQGFFSPRIGPSTGVFSNKRFSRNEKINESLMSPSEHAQSMNNFDNYQTGQSKNQFEGGIDQYQVDILDSDSQDFGEADADQFTFTSMTKQRLKVLSSKRHITKDVTFKSQTTKKMDKARVTEQELNDDTEFYSEVQQRFRQELIDSRNDVIRLNEMLKLAEKRNIKLVSVYTKEETARSVHARILRMPFPEQAETIKGQIDACFYNVAEGLDPSLAAVVQSKMQQIKDYFVGQTQLISHHSDTLRQNVALLENTNKDGMKFADLDTDRLIAIVSDVEKLKREQNSQLRHIDPSVKGKLFLNRPFTLWHMFHEHFGPEYFLEVIEEEYGIAPGANEFLAIKIQENFETHFDFYKMKMALTERHYQDQTHSMQQELEDLTETNARLMRHDQVFQDKALQELRRNQRVLIQAQEDATIKAWKAKYENARDKVVEMVKQGENQYRSLKGAQKNYSWKKWQMFTLMRKVINNVEESNRTGIDGRVLKLCQQFIEEEELILRYSSENDVPKRLALSELQIDKQRRLKHKLEEAKGAYGLANNTAAAYSMEIEQYRAEIEKLRKVNRQLRLQIPALQVQNDRYCETIRMKEQESLKLVDEIKNIETRWKNGMKEPIKYGAKTIHRALELKSLNEFGAGLIKLARSSKTSMCRNVSDMGTMTDIADLKYKVDYEKLPQTVLKLDKEVDATVLQLEDCSQTVKPIFVDMAVGTVQDLLVSKRATIDESTTSDLKLGRLSVKSELLAKPSPGNTKNIRKSSVQRSKVAVGKQKVKIHQQIVNVSDFRFPGGSRSPDGNAGAFNFQKIQEEPGDDKISNDAREQNSRRNTQMSGNSSALNFGMGEQRSSNQTMSLLANPHKDKKSNLNRSFRSESQQHVAGGKTNRTNKNVRNTSIISRASGQKSQNGSFVDKKDEAGMKTDDKVASNLNDDLQEQKYKNQSGNNKVPKQFKGKSVKKLQAPARGSSGQSRLVSATQSTRQKMAMTKSKQDLLGQSKKQAEADSNYLSQQLIKPDAAEAGTNSGSPRNLLNINEQPRSMQVESFEQGVVVMKAQSISLQQLDKQQEKGDAGRESEQQSIQKQMQHYQIIHQASSLPVNDKFAVASASGYVMYTADSRSQYVSQQIDETDSDEELSSFIAKDCRTIRPRSSQRQRRALADTDDVQHASMLKRGLTYVEPKNAVPDQQFEVSKKYRYRINQDCSSSELLEIKSHQVGGAFSIRDNKGLACVNETDGEQNLPNQSYEQIKLQKDSQTDDFKAGRPFSHLPSTHFLKQSRISEQLSNTSSGQETAKISAQIQSPDNDKKSYNSTPFAKQNQHQLSQTQPQLKQDSSPMLIGAGRESDRVKTKLQRLLIDGHLNEEQFICLQLLDKGYVPSRQDDSSPVRFATDQRQTDLGPKQLSRETGVSTNGLNILAQTTPITKWYGRKSDSPTLSRARSTKHASRRKQQVIEPMYRIYPSKLASLQKILDRAYPKTSSIGVQCSGYQSQQPFRINKQKSKEIIDQFAAETGEDFELVDAPSCLGSSLIQRLQRRESAPNLQHYKRGIKHIMLSASKSKLQDLTTTQSQSIKVHKQIATQQKRSAQLLLNGVRNNEYRQQGRTSTSLQKWLSCLSLDGNTNKQPLSQPQTKKLTIPETNPAKAKTQRYIKIGKQQANAARLAQNQSATAFTAATTSGVLSPNSDLQIHNLIVPKTGRHTNIQFVRSPSGFLMP